jgi:hypothetical protein
MQTTRSAILPLDVLWEYREFKRDEAPAPQIPFIHGHTIDEITQHISVHGLDPVDLSIIKDRALLTDGNHRIIAARRLGLEQIPVKVTVHFGDGSETFYRYTLDRFKLITPSLEYELKKIFLGGDMFDGYSKPDGPLPINQKDNGPDGNN